MDAKSNSRMVLSPAPQASSRSSGLNATEGRVLGGPDKVIRISLAPVSLTFQSAKPSGFGATASSFPDGEKAMRSTAVRLVQVARQRSVETSHRLTVLVCAPTAST